MSEPTIVTKPWGREVIWAHTEHYVGKILEVNAGEELSIQMHHHKDETMYVWTGSGSLHLFDESLNITQTILLKPGVLVRIEPNTIHQVIATTDLTILEASTNHLTDLIRFKDKYNRN